VEHKRVLEVYFPAGREIISGTGSTINFNNFEHSLFCNKNIGLTGYHVNI
jgi:hypothetical protein